MQKDIRVNVFRALKSAGIFDRVRDSRWRQQKLLILCYHCLAVEDENLWRPALFLTQDRLRQRFEMLKVGGYHVVPFDEGLERLRTNELGPREVVLTFDDGTYDFYKLVYPLLREYGFPATVYQTTHYCPRRLPVFPLICSYMLWTARGRDLPAVPSIGVAREISLAESTARESVVVQMQQFSERERLTTEGKNQLSAELAKRLEIDYKAVLSKRILQLMTAEEIGELASAGIRFELHTHRHRVPRDRELFLREIRDNRSALEDMTKTPAKHFCYPSGDYDPMFLPWLREAGIVSATTCFPALVSTGSHRLALPRFVDTTGQTEVEFEGWLTGAAALLSSVAAATGLRNVTKHRYKLPESRLQD
ncbi:MAG TPA: polysaccharide deacetylase family protein [Candidatus Sulfotelmatobacter sp.]|nr:polysaccharide deacetylase family protein [Candidatus Sulfotelmatobacter sp.]